jgi:hypothetical protein
MCLSKVVRYVPNKNLKYLPEGKSMFLTKFTKRKGMVKVEIDLDWVRGHTNLYKKLMGRR